LPKFVTFNAPNALCGPLLEHCDPITRSLLILFNFEKDFSWAVSDHQAKK